MFNNVVISASGRLYLKKMALYKYSYYNSVVYESISCLQLPVSSGRGRKPASLRRDVSIDTSLCDSLLSDDHPVCH